MGDAGAARAADGRAGLPGLRGGRGLPAHGVRRAAVARRAAAADARASSRGAAELNETRARVGLAPLEHVHGGTSRQLALVATLPQLEYPRRVTEPWLRVTGPLMWEQPFGEVELPPGDEPLVLVAPSTSQDPDAPAAAGRAGGPRGRARAGAGDDEPARAHRADRRAGQRPAGGLALVRPHDAPLRGRGLPRGPRNGGAGAGKRNAGGGMPARGRHGGERGPGALGRPGRVAAAPLPHAARRAPGGAAAARRSRLRGASGERARLVRTPTTGAATAADELEAFAASGAPRGSPGWIRTTKN